MNIYYVCSHTHTHLHFIPFSVDAFNFETCTQGDSSLRGVGFSTTPIIKSYSLSPVLLNTTHLFGLSQRTQQMPPERSLESSDRERKPLLRKCFHHRLSNLKMKGLLGCDSSLALHEPASSSMQLCETTEPGDALQVCLCRHMHIDLKQPSLKAKSD